MSDRRRHRQRRRTRKRAEKGERGELRRRLAGIRRALAHPDFQRWFAAARAAEPTPITSLDRTRELVLHVLAAMGVDTAGALLTFSWEPSTGKLGAYVRPMRARPSLPLPPRLDHP